MFLIWQRDAAAAIGSPRVVFRASEVPLLADAQALCERLGAEHANASARIAQAAHAAREAGYAEGFAAGRSAGRESIAATLTKVHAESTAERERLRAEVGALALEVVRKLAGQLDAEGVIAALAASAARDLVSATPFTLVVHTSAVEGVRARLAQSAPDLRCEIRGEASVPAETCCLVTEHGSIDASLAAQLERIESAWSVRS